MQSRACFFRIIAATYLFLCAPMLGNAGELAVYRVRIENTWSEVTHPAAFPPLAHFSWVGGGTHNDQVSLWSVGETASPAMVRMAETGETTLLIEAMQYAIEQHQAYSTVDQRHWFCPQAISASACGPTTFTVDVDSDFPLLSAVTMLGPSPDWFVGVDSLPLYDVDWIDHIELNLVPYDGGTRSENVFALGGTSNDPPDPIRPITHESEQRITGESLGTLTVSRIVACDIDGDYLCSSSDLDMLTESLRRNQSAVDLNVDGISDDEDRRYWVEQLMQTHFGDANLDGLVDFHDFVALASHFGCPHGWAGGDFDGSGETTWDDFLVLARNYDAGVTRVAAVPEPSWRSMVGLWMLAIRLLIAKSRIKPSCPVVKRRLASHGLRPERANE